MFVEEAVGEGRDMNILSLCVFQDKWLPHVFKKKKKDKLGIIADFFFSWGGGRVTMKAAVRYFIMFILSLPDHAATFACQAVRPRNLLTHNIVTIYEQNSN